MDSFSRHSSMDVPLPFESYSGDGPYSFASYAHADKVFVYKTLREFRNNGVNVWYDEGIPVAGEWIDELAQAIKKSTSLVVFVSPRSANSRYVNMEVQFALSEQKEILTIFLEDTVLPPGLSLCLQQFQSISISEPNWLENSIRTLLQKQDGVGRSTTKQPFEDVFAKQEDEIDHGLHLWSIWDRAKKAQDNRFNKKFNLGKKAEEKPIADPITPSIQAGTDFLPKKSSPPFLVKSEKTRHPFAVDVSVTSPKSDGGAESKSHHRDHNAGVFKWIPPGKITILVPYSDERRMVQVRNGFWLSEFVITQSTYANVMGANPSFSDLDIGVNSDDYPVNNVSWLDAISFCRALTMLANNEGSLPEKHEYRLPTEVEWEYACRAGSQSEYYFGDDPIDLHKHAWFRGNSRKQMHPVGMKSPNPWGLYDMYGNVREWVGNSFVNTLLNDSEQDEFRISRGGAYMKPALECKSSSRTTNSLHHRFRNLGFRVALAPSVKI